MSTNQTSTETPAEAEVEETASTTAEVESTATETTETPSQESVPGTDPDMFSREYVEKLRRESAGYREKAKTDAAAAAEAARTELTQSIGKALGLVKDDEEVTPEDLLAQAQADRTAAIEEANATKRELAVLRAAGKHDANTDELTDSASFGRKLAALDPTDPNFSAQVDELIKATVDGNPGKFKRVQVAASSGGTQHSGEGTTQLSREQLAALSPEERLKAAKDGRLRSLLKN